MGSAWNWWRACAVALLAASALAGEPTAAAKAEIEQLLTRLASSGCQFQRNGAWHNATEARAHLEKKYAYLLKKELVATAEDFIALAASKSSTTGKAYLVKCGAATEAPSAVWMTAQLKDMRARTRPAAN
jgi:hypothetical protein